MPAQPGCHEHLANTLPMRRRGHLGRLSLANGCCLECLDCLQAVGEGAPRTGRESGGGSTVELASRSPAPFGSCKEGRSSTFEMASLQEVKAEKKG
jgi:hypothetical protein